MAPTLELWYDKPGEADPKHSWLSLSPQLRGIPAYPLDVSPYPGVLALMEYARPDVVLTSDGKPFLAIELTQMNPSGHNLPQRFSCLVRAAELGIPAIYYCLASSRRSNSDPNPRHINVRVPLAQLRLTELFKVPSLTVTWPTNPTTNRPRTEPGAHAGLVKLVEFAVGRALAGKLLSSHEIVVLERLGAMRDLVHKYYSSSYSGNESYNSSVTAGECVSDKLVGCRISPPESCQLIETHALLSALYKSLGLGGVAKNKKSLQLLSRKHSLIYKGTANKSKDGPEHPYPGYLTLLDILYARTATGMVARDRRFNLIFQLPIDLAVFKDKALDRQTGLNILMEFSDLVVLNDALIVGGFLRNLSAGAVLACR